MVDVLIFIAALITLIIALIVMYVLYGQSKLKSSSNKYSYAKNKSSRSSRYEWYTLHLYDSMVHHGYVNNYYLRHALLSY